LPEFWKGLGALRVGAMAGVAAALTGFFLYIFGVIAEPPMAILYSGLEPREAGAVAAKLDAINVPYEQRGDGGTILIPADQVSRIRMQLATEGLPSAGVGYEIFDKSDTFGTSTFVQNVNRLRALEGELARTIRSNPSKRRVCISSSPSARFLPRPLSPPQLRLYSRPACGLATVRSTRFSTSSPPPSRDSHPTTSPSSMSAENCSRAATATPKTT
jgi:flagellar biosynthesis/type III secretory pathway M-ring protein FliF/YscJ